MKLLRLIFYRACHLKRACMAGLIKKCPFGRFSSFAERQGLAALILKRGDIKINEAASLNFYCTSPFASELAWLA
jgi:hypothetical protein